MLQPLVLLALVNVSAALGFLLPAAFWAIADQRPVNSLRITLPPTDSARDLAEIQATKDIEMLRHRAKVLTEAWANDQKIRELEVQGMARLFQWVRMLMVGCGIAFLLNAVAIWWCRRRN